MSGKNPQSDDSPSIPSFDDREVPQTALGFDFSNFAKSEADAIERAKVEAERHARRPAVLPEQRKIMRRSYLPPTDVVVDTRPIGQMTVVTLRGRINESFRGAELGQTLSGDVVFDLAEVDRVSSFGVKGWLQMLESARVTSCTFLRCSEAIVNQITMMRNFCGPGRIHSLMVPYTCNHCGEEFGALYEAVADRELILNRSPAQVECPNCHQAAEMDDDPWSYFAIDEHLLDAVPFELQQVVDHLTSSARIDPIEKFISEQETRVRFNAPLDARLRLRRAFAGLEGRVTLDLSVVPRSDDEGVAHLVDALRDLGPEVLELWIDGASVGLARNLLTNPIDRVYLSSMFVRARCLANGIERPVLVDVDRRRDLLRKQQLPPVEANWAMGNVDLSDTDVLFAAADRLAPPADLRRSRPLDTLPRAPQANGQVPPPVIRPAGPNQHFRNFAILFSTVMFVVATIALIIVAYLFVTKSPSSEPDPTVIEGPVDGWNGGAPVPPPWVDERFVVDEESVLVVGLADGTDVEPTSERARVDAVARLIGQLRTEVASRRAGRALLAEPRLSEPEAVVRQFLEDVGTWADPVRSNSALKRVGPTYTVATQHRLPLDVWNRLISHYGDSVSFRGLAVGRRFPTDYGLELHERTPLVVTKAASWFKSAKVRDGFVSVDEETVSTPGEFKRVAQQRWDRMVDGGRLEMQLFHKGRFVSVGFDREAELLPPTPAPNTNPSTPSDGLLPYEGRQ
ncbi:MAG: hypothetical protein AAGA48_16980 [Myxococcota bacterium]